MRVMFVVRSLEPGGAERQLVLCASGLRAKAHRVAVLVLYSGGPFEQELLAAGVEVMHAVKQGRWDLVGFTRRARAIVRSWGPDVIHGYTVVPNIVSWALALGSRARLVFGLRASELDPRLYDWLTRAALRTSVLLARWADLIIANSCAGKAYHAALGMALERILVIPNGVETDRFTPSSESRARVRAEWGLSPGDRLVGMVARWDPVKDHRTFLRAAGLAAVAEPSMRFVCVGGEAGTLERVLGPDVTRLGLEGRVRFVATRADMPSVYAALDLLVLPSLSEGFPNVVGEAMACGVPCVVTDVGDAGYIVGETGIVVPVGDYEAIAAAMTRWDVTDAKQYGRLARERVVAEFSARRLVERTETALEGVLLGSNS